MKGKVLVLVLLVIASALAATYVAYAVNNVACKQDIELSHSLNYLLDDGEQRNIEPMEEIDTPGMPG